MPTPKVESTQMTVGRIEQLNNKPADPVKFPSHVAGTCGSCAALRERLQKAEGLLKDLTEWYDLYCPYLSGGGLGTLVKIIRDTRKFTQGE